MQRTGIPAWVLPINYGSPGFVPPSGLDARIRDVVLLADGDAAEFSCPRARTRHHAGMQKLGWHLKREGHRVRLLCHQCALLDDARRTCGCPHPVT
jgi:hypothetical protein